jgi:hypothetical protein
MGIVKHPGVGLDPGSFAADFLKPDGRYNTGGVSSFRMADLVKRF